LPNSKLPKKVRALVLDFDGVFTDNKVIVFQDGREAVACDRSDGWGFDILKKAGVKILVLSGERNKVVQVRCRKLSLPCQNGIANKDVALQKWVKKEKIDIKDVVYVGNDFNDVNCLKISGCGMAVSDASPMAKKASDIVLKNKGGHGAVREAVEMIIGHLGIVE